MTDTISFSSVSVTLLSHCDLKIQNTIFFKPSIVKTTKPVSAPVVFFTYLSMLMRRLVFLDQISMGGGEGNYGEGEGNYGGGDFFFNFFSLSR